MNITGGITFSGAMGIRDQFPIVLANSSVATQNINVNAVVNFNPFISVSAGVPPYTYSNVGVLPQGLALSSGNGLVYGTTTAAFSTATVTFQVADSAGVVSTVTNPVSFTVSIPTYTVNYMIVAGGGGGGKSSPGGGAAGGGGNGGGATPGSFTAALGTTYTLTVGAAGGGAGPAGPVFASPGGASSITNGPGSMYYGNSSGGGAGGQGNPQGGTAPFYASGGIGGTGAGGGGGNWYTRDSNPAYNGNGGSGLTWSYNGVGYGAGGGAGGTAPLYPPAPAGTGGSPGGGPGGPPSSPGSNASFYGAGGGGGGWSPGPQNMGGAGYQGIILLAVPTPNYPGSAPGASVSTPPSAPGQTVLTYISSGTYTA